VDDAVVRFYDALAPQYHLIYGDWRRAVRQQAGVLDALIRRVKGDPPLALLDCTCGIGTQAIGLALLGYRVHGTDLSALAIDRARREAASFGASVTFAVTDVRALETRVAGAFDVVLSCDNALPHLPTEGDLRQAVGAIWSKLRDGGLLLVSVRDYDRLLRERPAATVPDVHAGPDARRIVFQIWDWTADSPGYRVDYFILTERGSQWETFHQTMSYRALPRAELTRVLEATGFVDVRWHEPEATGYFQPVVTASRSPC
jgi:glycine/sarcosine N-methyltransferase